MPRPKRSGVPGTLVLAIACKTTPTLHIKGPTGDHGPRHGRHVYYVEEQFTVAVLRNHGMWIDESILMQDLSVPAIITGEGNKRLKARDYCALDTKEDRRIGNDQSILVHTSMYQCVYVQPLVFPEYNDQMSQINAQQPSCSPPHV